MNFLDQNRAVIPAKKSYGSIILITLLVLLLLASLVAASFFYLKWTSYKNNPNKVSEDELQSTITAVGKLIRLPTGEQPTLATVADLTPLKGQAFFANAKVGDKVLVYDKAKKAYLYDPVENILVDVTTINPDAVATPPAEQKPAVSGSNATINPDNQ